VISPIFKRIAYFIYFLFLGLVHRSAKTGDMMIFSAPVEPSAGVSKLEDRETAIHLP
jgi:hypothetical protein